MIITKASGEKVQFDRARYMDSLERAGLSVAEAKRICNEINQDLYPEISSAKILVKTQNVLKNRDKILAAKYGLKRAIMALGPAGYNFEKYIASVLAEYGYQTRQGQIIKGHCVEQEIDVLAEKDHKKLMVECKFHTSGGQASDLKVAMYTYARFLDVKDNYNFDQPVLVTNTRCTTEAIRYSRCMGQEIIGWHYPNGQGSLEYYIESKKVYPITILPSLPSSVSWQLKDAGIFTILDLLKYNAAGLIKKFKISNNLSSRLLNEAQGLAA